LRLRAGVILKCISGSTVLAEGLAKWNQSVEVFG
jgi:hypothetical protein